MTKLHWEERFEDRVMTLPLTLKEKINIKMKVLEGQRTSRGDEGICVHIFEKEVINQDYKCRIRMCLVRLYQEGYNYSRAAQYYARIIAQN